MKKRRICTDLQEKSEVECQYSIQFTYDEVKHTIHITFYYTRCSIWIQGSPSKINNITVAHFFAIHYLERISNMVVKTVPLQKIGEELRTRITSFLTSDEVKHIHPQSTSTIETGKCVSCNRRCNGNGKSIDCVKCGNKQHFQCANIKEAAEREMFLSGGEPFVCNKCFSDAGVFLDMPGITEGNDDDIHFQRSRDNDIQENMEDVIKESSRGNPILQVNPNSELQTVIECSQSGRSTAEIHRIGNRDHTSELNSDKLLIRRLQCEISQLNAKHEEIQRNLIIENDRLKESLRVSIADLEREKVTKDTLQQCLQALRQSSDTPSSSSKYVQPPRDITLQDKGKTSSASKSSFVKKCKFFNTSKGCKNGADCNFLHVTERTNNEGNVMRENNLTKYDTRCRFYGTPRGCRNGDKCDYRHERRQSGDGRLENGDIRREKRKIQPHECRFFNKVQGCKKGDKCTFSHISKEPCSIGVNCHDRRCPFSHKPAYNGNSNVNFPQVQIQPKPPENSALYFNQLNNTNSHPNLSNQQPQQRMTYQQPQQRMTYQQLGTQMDNSYILVNKMQLMEPQQFQYQDLNNQTERYPVNVNAVPMTTMPINALQPPIMYTPNTMMFRHQPRVA